jgi:hypothetical protein
MGQQVTLPNIGCLDNQTQMEKLGFVFSIRPTKDVEFFVVELPEGWSSFGGKRGYPLLVDSHGYTRGVTTIKHGKLTFSWMRAIVITDKFSYANSDDDIYRMYWEVTHRGQSIHFSTTIQTKHGSRSKDLRPEYDKTVTWLDEHYPDWRSPFAYWD